MRGASALTVAVASVGHATGLAGAEGQTECRGRGHRLGDGRVVHAVGEPLLLGGSGGDLPAVAPGIDLRHEDVVRRLPMPDDEHLHRFSSKAGARGSVACREFGPMAPAIESDRRQSDFRSQSTQSDSEQSSISLDPAVDQP